MSGFTIPPSGLSQAEIEREAEGLGHKAHAYSEVGRLDTGALLHYMGGKVGYGPRHGARLELTTTGPRNFLIEVVVGNDNFERFVVAREVGRVCLHLTDERGNYRPMYRAQEGVIAPPGYGWESEDTVEANRFASALLLPRREFAQLAPERSDVELADVFGVSRGIVAARRQAIASRP